MIDWSVRQTICGIADLPSHSRAGVTHILSILDPEASEPEHFGAYPPHARLVLRFHDIIAPVPDMVLPEPAHVEACLAFGRRLVDADPAHLLVHCHMGLSRSTAAMAALLLQAHPDVDEDAVLDQILSIRPLAWPNSRVIAFADELLQRRGRLTQALGRLYGRQLRTSPELADFMRGVGRGAEVEMAK